MNFGDTRCNRLHIKRRRTGDALERNVIDITAREFGNLGDALLRRRRREQEDRIKRVGVHRLGELSALLRRIVDDENAINTRIERGGSELLDTHRFDRIGVAHQHHRRFVVVGTKVGDHAEHLPQADTLGERALGSTLDGRSVGHRIGERNAEFDDVSTGFDQRVHQRHGQRRIGITGRDERNQRLAALCLQALECSLYF